jgi:tetraacyldisaccharide 4'-kinase
MNPFSAIFGAGVALRNALYDRRVFNVRRLSRPVISVGNLSVGGSGKTPFVIALGKLLMDRGIAVDVLSRGYGRSAVHLSRVESDGTPEQFGDEPLLIARELRAPVFVGAARYRAGLLAEQECESKLHLLDDGFQHRQLHRDFDIVLLPPDDLNGTLLPLGRLREPIASLRRADIVAAESQDLAGTAVSVWKIRRELTVDVSSEPVIAFCGIARPAQFYAQLRGLNVKVADTASFPDHHRYTSSDADRLLRLRVSSGASAFVTTEKDMINLGSLCDRLQPVHVARLKIELDNAKEAISTLLMTLEQRCGCRF